MRIDLLPVWTLTNLQPAFYDSESGTALQQEARVYAKMQELIKDYNSFITKINIYIKDFESGIIKTFDEFRNCIIKTMNEYIASCDMRINNQDIKIAEAIDYMKDNIVETATNVIYQAIENGDLNVVITYDEPNEALNINVTRESE